MAQKKITDLSLRSSFDDTVNLPGDDTSQTWRVTGAQILAYMKLNIFKVVSKTTTYSAVVADHLVLCSGSAFTVTLPAASDFINKHLIIRKTDASFSNIITIARAGSDTIDGATSTTLNSLSETVTLISDGVSAWYILDRTYDRKWTSFTMTITGTTSNPTKGTIQFEKCYWRRVGPAIEISYAYRQSVAGSAGSGRYLYAIPSGLTIDSNLVIFYANNTSVHFATMLGKATVLASANYNAAWVQANDNANLMIDLDSGANVFGIPETFATTDVRVAFLAMVPITGWN